jgi:calcineurin-like phosphoesterase family protein
MRKTMALVLAASGMAAAQQLPAPPPPVPAWVAVKPIAPPATPLPSEDASANVTRFSFIGYGDTRSGTPQPGVAGDGEVVHPEHTRIVDRMIAAAGELRLTPFPVRFVLQSGDAVLRGQNGAMWNVSFSPVIGRLSGANIPYFFSAGNHDVTTMPAGDPGRALGLHNTLTAMSKLIPPEGSPRRLSGYLTYAFGYGNAFIIALDSNIAQDAVQFSWVADQLDHLDRARYRHVIAFFHHPPYSSGPHGGASAEPVPGTGRKAPDRVEAQTTAIRTMYMPLFRKHHVRLLVTGHDHLYDHWVERYDDKGVTYRMDTLVTGGGGAPITGYIGEPDLRAYAAASPADNIRLEHLMKPGEGAATNPHHFVLIRVDGDRLSVEVIGTGDTPYAPYSGGRSKISLSDSGS